jgi:hypothetical protein
VPVTRAPARKRALLRCPRTSAARSGILRPARSDLSVDGAKPYIDSFESVDTDRDNKISNAEFKAGCAAGLVHKFRKE